MDPRYPCMVECVSSLLLDLPILPLCCDRHIFGTPPEGDGEDENRPPTMADIIRAKRAARKAENNQGQRSGGNRSLHSPPIFIGIFVDTVGSHRERQRSEVLSSGPVTDRHSREC